MGDTENIIFNYALRHFNTSRQLGRNVLRGLDCAREPDVPKLFAAGNNFYRLAAGIIGHPVHPPEYFEPQNYPASTLIQPSAERQGE